MGSGRVAIPRKLKVTVPLVTALSLAMLITPTVGSAQTAPASMAGEILDNVPPVVFSSVSCNPTGTSSFNFSASGVAIGPYPGTFIATGSVTVGPETGVSTTAPAAVSGTVASGPVATYSESFTINSPATNTTISGSKTLGTFSSSFGLGWCDISVVSSLGAVGTVVGSEQSESYSAVISGSLGKFLDTGTGSGAEDDFTFTTVSGSLETGNGFLQYFTASNGVHPLCDQGSQVNQPQPNDSQGCVNP